MANSQFSFNFRQKGDYILRLQIWDDCWKDAPNMPEATKVISVTCNNEWTLANPFLSGNWIKNPITAGSGTHPSEFVFNWDFSQARYPVIDIDTTTSTTSVKDPAYQYEVYINGKMDTPWQALSPLKSSGTFQYQPTQAGLYTFRLYISDHCKTEIFDMPTPFVVSCGITPEPKITAEENVAFGVTFDNFEYRVRYDNRRAGFYQVRLSCRQSDVGALRGRTAFTWKDVCTWKWANTNNNPDMTVQNGVVTVQPQFKSGTYGRVVETLTLSIEDGCARDPKKS